MTKAMTRKMLALVLALMFTLTVAVVPAYACDSGFLRGTACAAGVRDYRDYTEQKVEFIVAAANAEIDFQIAMVRRIATERNVDWLLIGLVASTNRIAERTIRLCARYGAEVVCEYEEVEILGRVILVDPLRVISFRR